MPSALPSMHGRDIAMHASSYRSPTHAPIHRHRGRLSAAPAGHASPSAERLSSYQRALGAVFVPVCTSCIHAAQRQSRHSPTLGRRSHVATAATWQASTEQQQGAGSTATGMEAAAERLAAFCDALQADEQAEGGSMQGLTDSQLADLLSNVPGLIQEDPDQVRAKLDAISAGTGLDLAQTANLLARVPAAWNRSAEALVSRLAALGSEMGVSPAHAGALLTAVPSLFAITASIVKDRFDGLALRLGLPLTLTVELVIRQPLVWAVPVQQIQSGVPRLCERLGLSTSEAVDLAVRVPVVLALEERLLNMQVGGLASVLGVPVSSLVELLGRCLGLVAVPAEVLGANLSNLASALRVREEDALELVMAQPTLLNAQLASISTALDCLESGLNLTSRAQALRLLAQQPGLLYDLTVPAINEKLEALAALFQVSVSEVRSRAAEQPTLLLLAPYTLKEALAAAVAMGGEEATLERCMQLLVEDPGTFMSLAHTSGVLVQWTGQLGLDEDQVSAMAAAQPALLEMAPNTVKARLESLAALFGVPLGIAAQLVSRHPALATIPPNVVITRVKSLSMALGSTMQTMGVLVAKAPAVLACCIVVPGEVNRDLQPHTNAVSEVVAAYEFYTMEWLQRSIRDAAPTRARSFAQLDARL